MRRCVPPEGARGASGRRLTAGEELDSLWFQDRRTSSQHAFGEAGDVGGGGEKAGMSGDAIHDEGVLVVDLALYDAEAKDAVVFGRRNLFRKAQRGIESGVPKIQGRSDFAAEE